MFPLLTSCFSWWMFNCNFQGNMFWIAKVFAFGALYCSFVLPNDQCRALESVIELTNPETVENEMRKTDCFDCWIRTRFCDRCPAENRNVNKAWFLQVAITIQSLPPGNKDQYKCVFNDQEVHVEYITGAGGDTITCTTPDRNKLPPLAPNSGTFLSELRQSKQRNVTYNSSPSNTDHPWILPTTRSKDPAYVAIKRWDRHFCIATWRWCTLVSFFKLSSEAQWTKNIRAGSTNETTFFSVWNIRFACQGFVLPWGVKFVFHNKETDLIHALTSFRSHQHNLRHQVCGDGNQVRGETDHVLWLHRAQIVSTNGFSVCCVVISYDEAKKKSPQ